MSVTCILNYVLASYKTIIMLFIIIANSCYVLAMHTLNQVTVCCTYISVSRIAFSSRSFCWIELCSIYGHRVAPHMLKNHSCIVKTENHQYWATTMRLLVSRIKIFLSPCKLIIQINCPHHNILVHMPTHYCDGDTTLTVSSPCWRCRALTTTVRYFNLPNILGNRVPSV